MTGYFTNEVDYTLLELIKKDFFNHQNSVIINDKSVSGNRILPNGVVELGTWAGPNANISNLFHEMGHFVEIDQARMNKYGWGLNFGKFHNVLGHSWYESSTAQAVWREIRVWSYQMNLLQHYGISETVEELTESADYLEAIHHIAPGKNKEDRLAVVADAVKVLMQTATYQVEAFKAEWNRRTRILERKIGLTSKKSQ